MLIDQLKRNQNILHETIAEVGDSLVAKKPCTILIPFRWLKAGLLELGANTYCATIFPLIVDDKEYAVSNVCTKMEITPSSIEIIKHDGEDHYAFRFDKGATITPSVVLVQDSNFSYLIYDELIQKSKAPWFLNYMDIGKVMATSKTFSGVNLADTNAIFELIVSTLSYNKTMDKQYREVIKSLDSDELAKTPREGSALNNVVYATTNKMNKLMGGYIEDGLTSALTENESPISGVEQLLRKQ